MPREEGRRRGRENPGGCGGKTGVSSEGGSSRKSEQRRDRKARTRGRAGGGGAEAPGSASVRENEEGTKGARTARGDAVPAEIVQDAAGNLHPFGLHDEDPQREQCIPAPRGRGPRVRHGDSGSPERGKRRQRRQLQRRREGEGAGPAHFRPAPSAPDPRLGQSAGRSPGSHAPALLERSNRKLGNREAEHAKPMKCLFIGLSSPIRLQAAPLLFRKPTSRRL